MPASSISSRPPQPPAQPVHGLRYFVTEPIHGGYAYWDVRDRLTQGYPNFSVASFFKGLDGAEGIAHSLCDRLNRQPESHTLSDQLNRIERNQNQMALDLKKITDDVAALTSVEQSAIALLQALKAAVDAIPTSTDPTTQAAIDDLSAQIETGSSQLAAAITANTPSSTNSPANPTS